MAALAPIVDAISLGSGELVHVSRRDGDRMLPIYDANLGHHAIKVEIEAGLVLPLLTTSSGKAALAFGAVDDLAAIVERQRKEFGAPPMPDVPLSRRVTPSCS